MQRNAQILLSAFIGLLYMGEAIALSKSETPERRAGTAGEGIVFALFSLLVWLVLLLSLYDVGAAPKGRSFYATWVVAAAFEVIFLSIGAVTSSKYSKGVQIVQVALQSIRTASTLVLVALEFSNRFISEPASDEETVPLLADASTKNVSTGDDVDPERFTNADLRRVPKNWWLYVRGFKLFLPILRPRTVNQYLCILGVCLCIVVQRGLNVAGPVTLGAVVTALNQAYGEGGEGKMPWTPIMLYLVIKILESSAGVHLLKDVLWQPFEQVATQNMKTAAYDKLMSLSCDFHDNKKSDVTFKTVERGSRITDLLETICFSFLPMAADLVISISVFWYLFDGYVGFVVGLVVVLYIWSTLKTLSQRAALWREYIEVWEREWYSMTESVKSWDSVSHFGRIPYEMNNFKDRTDDTRKMSIKWLILSKILGGIRSFILASGQGAGVCIVASHIVQGDWEVGKFIVFTAYWAQLSTPLHFFASGFNSISRGLVDAEKLLTLFEKTPTIQNAEDATPFVFKEGAVDFKNVSFSYDDKRTVTNGVSFHADAGKIIAFVGETGCGKSTLFKLLFRFHDPKEGSIFIDGQNIKDVTLDSFRDHLGVVPQDVVLFNKSIRENLRYPDLDATDQQIEDACKAVSLHEKITSFTKGYDEVIGERGTKLSGGERQRVAIARAILKDPGILLLDEATSSVDSTTEALIQASLKALQKNRTTFVIAHRLSTIVNADQVVVMDEGKILELGTHDSLIKQNGAYKKLWTSQLSEHMSELRGRSKSRSKSGKEREKVLKNDINSSDDSSKDHLVKTLEPDGCKIAKEQSKVARGVSAHEISHGRRQEPGQNPARYSQPLKAQEKSVISTQAIGEEINHKISEKLASQIFPGGNAFTEQPHTENGDMAHKSGTEISSRRHQSASGPANQGPISNDGACDDEIPFSSSVNTKRRGLGGRGRHGGNRRTVSYTGDSGTAKDSPKSMPRTENESAELDNRVKERPRFKLHSGRNSGGLKRVENSNSSESSESASDSDNSTENGAVVGLETPLLNVPENSPARGWTPSPGAFSEANGGMVLNGSPKK
jgi:ABC-type transport system involved in Fe-S cluster assembly fused permease/ATPase subunit